MDVDAATSGYKVYICNLTLVLLFGGLLNPVYVAGESQLQPVNWADVDDGE